MRIEINNKIFDVIGSNVKIQQNKVFVDEQEITNLNDMNTKEIVINVHGDIAGDLIVTSGDVNVTGSVNGVQNTNGNVIVSSVVKGNVSTVNGNIGCMSVAGDASTVNGDILWN